VVFLAGAGASLGASNGEYISDMVSRKEETYLLVSWLSETVEWAR
jgi:hypothetical protein